VLEDVVVVEVVEAGGTRVASGSQIGHDVWKAKSICLDQFSQTEAKKPNRIANKGKRERRTLPNRQSRCHHRKTEEIGGADVVREDLVSIRIAGLRHAHMDTGNAVLLKARVGHAGANSELDALAASILQWKLMQFDRMIDSCTWWSVAQVVEGRNPQKYRSAKVERDSLERQTGRKKPTKNTCKNAHKYKER
jgi:hypothetical protein